MFNGLKQKVANINWAVFTMSAGVTLILILGIGKYLDNPVLPEYKGGVQNHLVWNIKGECFFVRPATNTVYLVRVEDCDKGNK